MSDADNQGGTASSTPEKDPLVWQYERERRLKIGGSVQWEHTVDHKSKELRFFIRSNFSFAYNACYIDVLIPTTMPAELLGDVFQFVLENAERYAKSSPVELQFPLKQEAFMAFDSFPEHKMSSRDCAFTGRVYVYTGYALNQSDKEMMTDLYRSKGLSLIIRDSPWIEEVQRFIDRPVVFLGHDSGDKDDLVRELAHLINGKEISVWYDEISLRPGDRLRKSLDAGLEEADYFMPVITKKWMANDRYAEYEFDAIMQRFITEKSVKIVPICVGVDPSQLKEKSRVLADILAIVHRPEDTVSNLAHKISNAVDPNIPNIGEPLPPLEPPAKPGLFSVGLTIGPLEPSDDSNS